MIRQDQFQRGPPTQVWMRRVQPHPHRFWFLEKVMEDFDGSLHWFEGGLNGLSGGVSVEGLVVQLQSFGETLERDPQVGRKSLCINASACIVMQFGEGYLRSDRGRTRAICCSEGGCKV